MIALVITNAILFLFTDIKKLKKEEHFEKTWYKRN